MHRFFADTWLATIVFVTVTAIVSFITIGAEPSLHPGSVLTAIVIVPLVWRWLVSFGGRARVNRGAAAGAFCTIFILNLPSIFYVNQTYADGWFGIGRIMLVSLSVSVGGPVGAVLGMLTAVAQSRWSGTSEMDRRLERDDMRPSLTGRRGLIGMLDRTWIATLIFVPTILAMGSAYGAENASFVAIFAFLVTPPIWWRVAAATRPPMAGRGAIAGATIFALVAMAQAGLIFAPIDEPSPHHRREWFVYFIPLGALWIVSIPIGAGLGALAAVLQCRLSANSPPSRPSS